MKFTLSVLLGLVASGAAYKATTTRYYDGQKGACGCGDDSGLYSWQLGISTDVYTAAGSQALFDTDDATWCGGGCGKCYNLTSTGSSACSTCGTGGVSGESIIVMVTNLCPYNGNEQWCPSVGATNDYGYSYHFDIMAQSEAFGDNVVVDFEPVACPGQAASDWATCQCYGETASDTTPAGMTSAGDSSSSGSSSSSSSSSPTTTLAAAKELSSTSSTTSSATAVTTSTQSEATSPAAAPTAPATSTLSTSTLTTGTKATSTKSGCQAKQTLYGQCGGIGWMGPTACTSGATCKQQNDYYYQCVAE